MINNIFTPICGYLWASRILKNKATYRLIVHRVWERGISNTAKPVQYALLKTLNRNLLDISHRQPLIINDRKFHVNRRPRTQLMDLDVVTTPNLFNMITKVFNTFIIKNLDNEFDMAEFLTTSKTALVLVTKLLSELNFSDLNGLLTDECRTEVEKNVRAMDSAQRQSLVINMDDIVLVFPYKTSLTKGGNEGEKIFFEVTVVYQIHLNYKNMMRNDWKNMNSSLREYLTIYNCRFIREFTKGVEDQWTINGINIFKLNETEFHNMY